MRVSGLRSGLSSTMQCRTMDAWACCCEVIEHAAAIYCFFSISMALFLPFSCDAIVEMEGGGRNRMIS